MRASLVASTAIAAALLAGCERKSNRQEHTPAPAAPTARPAAAPSKTTPALDTATIERLTGAKGKASDDGKVFKVSVPRKDLTVKTPDVVLTPGMGLTAWAAFQPMGDHTMVMGDIVLTEDRVAPTMDAALGNGLEVTALHNHFFGEQPKIMFMHVGGMGDQKELASAIGKVFAAMKGTSPKQASAAAPIDPAKSSLDAARLDAATGQKGELKDGVYKITVGRTAKMMGTEVGNAMGVNTWAAFAGSNDHAVVDGDFVMHEDELQPVLKALRAAGIQIVAIHNHMTGEEPRMMFLHYWGVGPAEKLAQGVKSALDKTSK